MLFTKDFLDELSSKPGVNMWLNDFMDNKEMNFYDSILKISEMFGLEPQYIEKR